MATLRNVVAGLFGVAGAAFLAWWLNAFQPLRGWFIWDLAVIWLWQLFFVAACVSVGLLLVTRLISATDRTAAFTVVLAFPLGLLVFTLCMYLFGFLRLYGAATAIIIPLGLLLAGLPNALRWWRSTPFTAELRLSGLPLVASIAGVLLVGVIYLGALTPDAVNYDAAWMHLALAQDFAREGRIIGYPGNWVLNTPHAASLIYTWDFLVPGISVPQLKWMMALHTEFIVLLWCLAGIALATQWLAERAVAGTWAALALFPAIFVYDSNLGAAADHFAMLYAPPMLLLTPLVARRFERGPSIVWGALGGAAISCKMQAAYFIAPLALALTVQAVILWRSRQVELEPLLQGWLLLPAAALVAMLGQFGGNLVLFNNPVYPLAQNLFTGSTPTLPGGAEQASNIVSDWHCFPQGPTSQKVTSSLAMVATFSFIPHYSFLKEYPVFGSLFTLSLPLLLVIGRARRVWLGAGVVLVALLMWAATYRVDRNLQIFYPLLIAVTAAILLRAWELGRIAKVGVLALVAVQVAWGSALYVSGSDRIGSSVALLRSTIDGQARAHVQRTRGDFVDLGRNLPADARVLLHHHYHVSLGIDRPLILDMFGFQALIDYRTMKSARDLWDRLHELGISHVVMAADRHMAWSVQEEIVFDLLVDACGAAPRQHGGLMVFPLCATPPAQAPVRNVAMVGVGGYADGLYGIEAVGANTLMPPALVQFGTPRRKFTAAPSPLEEADVFLQSSGVLSPADQQLLSREFRPLRAGSGVQVWVRRQAPLQPEQASDPRCQSASDLYGLDGATTGLAPHEVVQWWSTQGCSARPRTSTAERCQTASNLYGVVAEVDWGDAPESARAWWTAAGCNTAPRCQDLSELYGVEAQSTFAYAPTAVQAWWKANGCATRPAEQKDPCARAAEKFGLAKGELGFSPSWVRAWWQSSGCEQK